jgi:hypothetical protein
MTKYKKDSNGNYIINGRKYEMLEGSRAQVMHGTAYKTSGELTKNDLIQNKNGRIVSKKKHNVAKREKRLIKAGYGTKKGHFGAVRLSGRHTSKRISSKRRRMKGGNGSVVAYNSYGVPSENFRSVPSNVTNLSNIDTYK